MAETLAAFAHRIGVSPATARQWKRRGRIKPTEDGFELMSGNLAQMAASVTKRDNVTAKAPAVTSECDKSVTSPECVGCAALRDRVTKLEELTTMLSHSLPSHYPSQRAVLNEDEPTWGA